MIKTSVKAGLAAMAMLLALSAQAADPVVGQKLFNATCLACHGADGATSLMPEYPRLAGQKAQYLTSSLKAFRDGVREGDIMNAQAEDLSDVDIVNLAAFISRLPQGLAPIAESINEQADPTIGQRLYDASCMACHGQKGISVAQIYPNLAGQNEAYLVKELHAFRDGERADPIMMPMARHLSDDDIAHISLYLAQLQP